MINFTRNPNAPTALNTPEIQQYINDAIDHLADPKHNAKPEKPVSYRTSDLLEAFDRDFHSKCYLTEQKFVCSDPMDIEHFLPQNERPDLVYTWTNLFPAEHKTNMIKPRATPAGGYLDPCDPADDVENEINQVLISLGEIPQFEAVDPTNQRAANTANLLNRVHNGHDETTERGTRQLRHAIQTKYKEILAKICEWYQSPEGSLEKLQAKSELKLMLSRKSSFTMLCRSIAVVRQLPAEFFD